MKTKEKKIIKRFRKMFKRKSLIPTGKRYINEYDNECMEFTISIKNLSKEEDKAITELISNYKEEIIWDDVTGEVIIDGLKNLPYSKEYWLPTPDNKSVDMELHTLNQEELIKNAQIMSTKINANLYKKFIVPTNQYQEIKITEPIEPEIGFHKININGLGEFEKSFEAYQNPNIV